MVRHILLALVLLVAASCTHASGAKVEKNLQNILNAKQTANIIVSFSGSVREIVAQHEDKNYPSRGYKISALKSELEKHTASSQQSAQSLLKSSGIPYKSFWANNKIYIAGASADLVQALADLDEVDEIREEVVISLAKISPKVAIHNGSILAEWNIEKIEAPQAWVLPGGNNGNGAVVANMDTGVRYTHEALRDNYRSSYGWFDPYTGTANPADGNGMGTQSTGIMVGAGGIGVAPGAQWIACRGCSTSSCTEAALIACGQWVACPTLPDGTAPVCSMAPSVAANSWGGGAGQTWYDEILVLWRAAGILPLFAMGNGGPTCGTVASPGDSQYAMVSGCTSQTDETCSFTGRGPTMDGRIKPDISAPGGTIRSASNQNDNAYASGSGSSLSLSHIAGTAALLKAQNPNFTSEEIETLIKDNADRNLGTATACGGIPSDEYPNNVYGWGRVNARRALEAAINGK